MFSAWAGISPKKFLQFLNREYLKEQLAHNQSVLDSTFNAGLSSTSRTHDLFIQTEGMSPAQYREAGKGLTISYGIHPSPFGEYLIGICKQQVCYMAFIDDKFQAIQTLQDDWPNANIEINDAITLTFHRQIWEGYAPEQPVQVLLRGTPFQLKVWEALINLPSGTFYSFDSLAQLSGQPSATRAAASAIARNRIAWLIPCHRVIRKIGESGEYRWGKTRKQLMLGWEAAQFRKK